MQAVQDQHNEQLQAIEENGRLSPTKFNQVQEELRRGELLNHNKKVKALEKKNTEQEKNHAKMITMMEIMATMMNDNKAITEVSLDLDEAHVVLQ